MYKNRGCWILLAAAPNNVGGDARQATLVRWQGPLTRRARRRARRRRPAAAPARGIAAASRTA